MNRSHAVTHPTEAKNQPTEKETHPTEVEVVADAYQDSVRLLEASRAMREANGVEWAAALMATPANLESLIAEGFQLANEAGTANDLVLAVRADDAATAAAAINRGRSVLFGSDDSDTDTNSSGSGVVNPTEGVDLPPRADDLNSALTLSLDANVVTVSVPGSYAALEAHKALTHGCHVLLFSDNISINDEVALKQRARSKGLLLMGPGAGTARLGGVGLGFANRVPSGTVGVVAAAGTGAQEVMSLLAHNNVGVSGVIGVGGRDLNAAVGGVMTSESLRAFDHHDSTEAILLVSKPPAPSVAETILQMPLSKPLVAALLGIEPANVPETSDRLAVCDTLEGGVLQTLARLGVEAPDLIGTLDAEVARAITALSPKRNRLIGLFSGGTLCYETMTVASAHIGPILSNTPLRDGWDLPTSEDLSALEGAHLCLDLGEEEYTQGRPHPMIDPAARLEMLNDLAFSDDVAVVILDVVLGDGSHENPAGMLAPAVARTVAEGAVVVAYVLGTEADPQRLSDQQRVLSQAGAIVTKTATRAALAAAAVINRDPALVLSP